MVLLQIQKEDFFTQIRRLICGKRILWQETLTLKLASKLSFQKGDEKIILATLLNLFCFCSLFQSKKGRF